jgi:Na+/proline symporter
MGIVVASLLAAYMSTMASSLNWGSSYVVNDVYRRFINPDAPEKQLVMVGRISTVILMILTAIIALLLENALQAFYILMQIGAGTGLIFILRWFWWRINAWTEITGMVVSFIVAIYFEIIHLKLGFAPLPTHIRLIMGVAITSVCWILVTLVTKPSADKTLRSFYRLIRPGGRGWDKVIEKAAQDGDPIPETALKGDLPIGILCMIAGCFGVYGALFAAGYYMYGKIVPAVIFTIIAVASTAFLVKVWGKLEMK